MAVKKNKPNMAPVRKSKGAQTGKLMDNQDTVNKGDGTKKATKVPTTILLPAHLKEEAQAFAEERGTTLTGLIIDGLYLRMKQGY